MLQYLVNELLPCPSIHVMFDARRVIPLQALDTCLHLQAQRHQEFTFLNATGIPYVQLLERLPSCITSLAINLPCAHLCSNDIQILLWGALERKWGVPGPDRHTGVLATCRRALEPEQLCGERIIGGIVPRTSEHRVQTRGGPPEWLFAAR